MADRGLVSIQIDEATLAKYLKKYKDNADRTIIAALDSIKREWQREFYRQLAGNNTNWRPLKTWVSGKTATVKHKGIDPQSYFARKKHAYFSGKTKGGGVKYLRVLTRTGAMVKGYVEGVNVDILDYTVNIPFPKDPLDIRAKVHQGLLKKPTGVLAARKWNTQRFKTIAAAEFKKFYRNTRQHEFGPGSLDNRE